MQMVDQFADPKLTRPLVERLQTLAAAIPREVRLMEVCGTHTMSFFRTGVRSLLPPNVRLLSGPGCPVCVTPNRELDTMIAFAELPDVIVTTFGDMMRVPGSNGSLMEARGRGGDIRIVYSPFDALELAQQNRDKTVVFLGVGFETTAPTVAATALEAQRRATPNFCVYCAHKLVPPALDALLSGGDVRVDAFIMPGHVSAIIGALAYEDLLAKYGIPSVVTGFMPTDLLDGLIHCLEAIVDGRPTLQNTYSRFVRPEGNPAAQGILNDAFEVCDAEWRGFGTIPASGLRLKPSLAAFDAVSRLPVAIPPPRETPGCLCGEVLKGIVQPTQCKLFGTACTPESPVGPCMVSSEGACAAHFKYGAATIAN